MSEVLSRTERTELAGIVRRNFRVAKAGIDSEKARVLADFEAALSKEWDPVELACKEIVAEAQAAIQRINKRIREQFKALGLPASWAPIYSGYWDSRGETSFAARRAELRKAAITRAEAEARDAKLALDRREAGIQTEIASTALTSEAAQAFLRQVPNLAELMPPLEVEAPPLEAVNLLLGRRAALSAKRAQAGRAGGLAKGKQLASGGEQVASEEGRP
jgi:hypothetical protein